MMIMPLMITIVASLPLAADTWPPASVPASRAASRPASQPTAHPRVKEMCFAAVTLDGRVTQVPRDYAGKLVLVSFWATWCPSSKRELPYWKDAYAKYHDRGLEFLGLPTDKNRKRSEQLVRQFLAKNEITWPQAFDDAPVLSGIFGVESLPTSFLVDGDTGAVLLQGDELRKKNLEKQLEAVFQNRAVATSQPACTQPAAPP
jgi:thiol-disulfide isomerase/thioredoxin